MEPSNTTDFHIGNESPVGQGINHAIDRVQALENALLQYGVITQAQLQHFQKLIGITVTTQESPNVQTSEN